MRYVTLIVLVFALAWVLAPSPAQARLPRGGDTGGAVYILPTTATAAMIANHHEMTAVAEVIEMAIERGAPIVSRIPGAVVNVYYSPAARRFIVLTNDGTARRVWKFVYEIYDYRVLRFITNFYMSERNAFYRAIRRVLREGARQVLPPYWP